MPRTVPTIIYYPEQDQCGHETVAGHKAWKHKRIFRERILKHSVSTDYETAVQEWRVCGVRRPGQQDISANFIDFETDEEIHQCICSHPIKRLYYVENVKNDNCLLIGIDCLHREGFVLKCDVCECFFTDCFITEVEMWTHNDREYWCGKCKESTNAQVRELWDEATFAELTSCLTECESMTNNLLDIDRALQYYEQRFVKMRVEVHQKLKDITTEARKEARLAWLDNWLYYCRNSPYHNSPFNELVWDNDAMFEIYFSDDAGSTSYEALMEYFELCGRHFSFT